MKKDIFITKLFVGLFVCLLCCACMSTANYQNNNYVATPQSNTTQSTRALFTYNKTFEQDSKLAALYPNLGQEEKLSFGLITTNPELSFSVRAVRQQVSAKPIGSQPADQSSYIKSVAIQELPGHQDSCARIKVSFYDSHTLRIQCKDVFGLIEGSWLVHLYNNSLPKCAANCSVINHF